jgi:hypothetical protein
MIPNVIEAPEMRTRAPRIRADERKKARRKGQLSLNRCNIERDLAPLTRSTFGLVGRDDGSVDAVALHKNQNPHQHPHARREGMARRLTRPLTIRPTMN